MYAMKRIICCIIFFLPLANFNNYLSAYCPACIFQSRRFQKPVNYSVNDLEADDADKSSDRSDKGYSDEEAVELDLSSAQGVSGDAAAGHDEKKQHDSGAPALEDHLHRDNVEMGGGFCTDKFEIGRPDVSPHGDSFEAEFSKDYLEIGGGFCLDEDETQNDQDGAHDPTMVTASGNAELSHCSGLMDEADLDCGSVQFNLGPKGALNEAQYSEKTDAYWARLVMPQVMIIIPRSMCLCRITLKMILGPPL